MLTWYPGSMTFCIHEQLLVRLIRLVSGHPARPRGNGALARGSFDGDGKDWDLGKPFGIQLTWLHSVISAL